MLETWKITKIDEKSDKTCKFIDFGPKTVFQKASFSQLLTKTIKVTEVGGTVLRFGKNPLFPKSR